MTPAVVSKSEFARLMNVTPTRVGQWIRENKIGPDALEGEGRSARVRVEVARRQVGDRLDIGQRFGNGIATRLDFDPPAEVAPIGPSAPGREARATSDPVADSIKAEKLRGLQYANRKAAEEELARTGLYVRADQTSAAMARLAGALINVVEGGLGDMAQAMAAKFEIPARDVLHLLRAEFRAIRAKAAARARQDAEQLPDHIDDEVADASDPAQGEA